jgi:excisionase family DNA binding protein
MVVLALNLPHDWRGQIMESTRITFDLVESTHVRSLLIDHAAELLGVSRRTVYYRIRDGRLRTIRTRCGSQRVLVDSAEEMLRDEMRPPPVDAD